MSIDDVKMLFTFCGGLGMFLYGMRVMSDGVQKSAGNRMQDLLRAITNNRLFGVLLGALITAIIQSSGATTVMVVGFVNAGLMNLSQAVGVIMGANIGTTITSWIVSMDQLSSVAAVFSPSFYAPLLVGFGAILITFSKKDKNKNIGGIIIGLGLLFCGLQFMKDAAGGFTNNPVFTKAVELFSKNPILGILVGVIITAIMQSSSASVGILQMLASTGGAVTYSSAVYLSLGSNIGSCVTAIISSLGTTKTAKRTAVIHLMFNVIGVIVFGILFVILFKIRQDIALSPVDTVGISIFHTIFNVTCTLIMFPFADLLLKLSGLIVKEDTGAQSKDAATELTVMKTRLDDRFFNSPAVAINNALKEVVHMGNVVSEELKYGIGCIVDSDQEMIDRVYKYEEVVDEMEQSITDYLARITRLSLTSSQHDLVNHLFYTVSDIERAGDHVDNVAEQAEYMIKNTLSFSEMGIEDLKQMAALVQECFDGCIKVRDMKNPEDLRKVVKLEDEIDSFEEDLRAKHIERLANNECSSRCAVVFLEVMTNLERVADHAYNVAGYVKDEL